MPVRKLLSGVLSLIILVFCFTSCCRDCDNIEFPSDIKSSVGINYSNSILVFADTVWNDTVRISTSNYAEGVNAISKKQFLLDCEECGTKYIKSSLSGFNFGDSVHSKALYHTELLSGSNSFTIKDSTGDVLFIQRNSADAHRLDSLIIFGRIYKDVLQLNTLSCVDDSSLNYCHNIKPYFTKLIFARGIGLIYFEIDRHPQHGLIRYYRIP